MQYVITVLALLISFNVAAQDNEFVALNIQPGLWEYQTEMDSSKMMEAALASVPEAQREMVKKMMEGKMQSAMIKPIRQCMTAEQIKDPRSHFEQATKDNKVMDDCKIKVVKSTSSNFVGELQCSGAMPRTKIDIAVKSRKKTEGKVVAMMQGGQATEITSTGTWIAATCP